jgi:PAS domain S-box-containing protein
MPKDSTANRAEAAQVALEQSQTELRLLVEQVREYAMFLLDQSGVVISWNRGAERIKQYAAAEIIGQHFSRFYTPEDRASGKPAFALRTAIERGSYDEEGWRVRKDGSRFWASVVLTQLRDADGRPTGFAKITRDLTDRRRNEEVARRLAEERVAREQAQQDEAQRRELLAATERLAAERGESLALLTAILDNAPAGIAFLDAELRFLRVNQLLAAFHGLPVEAHLGRSVGELGLGDPELVPALARVLRTGEPILGRDVVAPSSPLTGRGRTWSASYFPLALGGDRRSGVAIVVADVTERRRAEDLLRRQTRHAALRADIGLALASSDDIGRVLDATVDAIVRHLGVAVARVWLADERGDALRLHARAGAAGGAEVGAAVRIGDPPVGAVAARRAPWSTSDLAADGDGDASVHGWAIGAGLVTFAACPLLAGERLVGVIDVYGTRDVNGDLCDALGYVADTLALGIERTRALTAQRASRDQLDVILRSIAEGVTAQGPGGELVYANDAAARMSGFDTAAEMLAAPIADVVARYDIRDATGAPLPLERLPGRQALAGRAGEAQVRVRDRVTGEERWTTIAATPVLDDRGRAVLAINVFRDVTESKRTEEAWRFLAEATAVLASSLEFETTLASVARLAVPHMADWCTVDLVGEGDAVRDQLAIAHVDPAKVEIAREYRRRWPPGPGDDSAVARVIRTGVPELVPEITDAMVAAGVADPERRAVITALGLRSTMIVPLVVAGRASGAITFISAESGRRYQPNDLIVAQQIASRASLAIEHARMFENAQRAVRIRDAFLSIASHELKTPLTTLLLQADGLRRDVDKGGAALAHDRLRRRAVTITQHVDRLNALVDQLLDVSRISGGPLQLQVEKVDVAAIAREVVERHREEARQVGSELVLAADAPVVVEGDQLRLEQVITNLVTNAMKYGAGKPVDIAVERVRDRFRIAVRDRGIGIAPEDQHRIFERFERLVSDQHYGGFGLGLWIVKQIVDALGGTIAVASEPGAGAAFEVDLPVVAPVAGVG